MDPSEELVRALRERRWDDVARLNDRHALRIDLLRPHAWLQVFEQLPTEVFDGHPRFAFTRAVLRVLDKRFTVIAGEDFNRFQHWASGEDAGITDRDRVLARVGRLSYLRAVGSFAEARELTHELERAILEASDLDGLDDLLPGVYIPMGAARMLAGDLDGALSAFGEARRWSVIGGHPAEDHARVYFALALALTGDPARARAIAPPWIGRRRAPQGSLAFVYESASLALAALLALAGMDERGSAVAVAALDDGVDDDELWWAGAHARARHQLYWGDRVAAAEELERTLLARRSLSGAGTLAQTVLLADLADLYQALGELRASQVALDRARPGPFAAPIVASRARAALLRGDHEDALRILDADGSAPPGPAELMVRADAELTLAGSRDAQEAVNKAIDSVVRRGSTEALAMASERLRDQLVARLPEGLPEIPRLLPASSSVSLTRREREILLQLHEHETLRGLSSALFISVNTTKSHLRNLYRKLGVQSRDQALTWSRRHDLVDEPGGDVDG